MNIEIINPLETIIPGVSPQPSTPLVAQPVYGDMNGFVRPTPENTTESVSTSVVFGAPYGQQNNTPHGQENASYGQQHEGVPQQSQSHETPQPEQQSPIQQEKLPHDPDPQQETSLCDTDSRYTDVAANLPTGLCLVPYTRLSVRPLQLTDHIKLGSGTRIGSYRIICEAIGACIDRDWRSLPFSDFIYIAYWLRLNSYKENRFSIEWTCDNRDHNREVFTGKVSQNTLKNTTLVEKADLRINVIDYDKLLPLTQELYKFGIVCKAPSVDDFLFTLENMEMVSSEDALYFDLATALSTKHGDTLVKRVAFLKNMVASTPEETAMDIIAKLQDVVSIVNACGVVQYFNVVCKHCGHTSSKEAEVDLLTFFPFGK